MTEASSINIQYQHELMELMRPQITFEIDFACDKIKWIQ